MRDFLMEFLKISPHIPPHALWRAMEARLLYDLTFEEPILDLGCGDGNFAEVLFANKNLEVVRCDISKECVKSARSCGIYKSVDIADARCLPYKNNSFATVVSNCILEHIPKVKKVLCEISRILRKGGRLIFTVPSENFTKNLKNQDPKYIESLNRRLEMFHYYSPKEWEELLGQCSLTLERYKYYLPKQVQQIWETLTQLFIKKVIGRELFTLLGSKKLGIGFIVQIVFPILFYRYLKKWHLTGTQDDEGGGGLLIIAYKN